MDAFPAFFPLNGRQVVIAGDGEAAEGRARLFANSPAEVRRIGAAAAVEAGAYIGARLAFIAFADAVLAERAAAAARAAGAVVNVFDRPALSDFHTPAIINRGQVVAAIGTGGAAPVLAQLLRAEVEARVPESAGAIAAVLGENRADVVAAFPDLVQRRAFVRAVLSGAPAAAAEAGDIEGARARLEAMIAAGFSAIGRVWLIETPDADDLISVRAQRALNFADVIIAPASAEDLIARHTRRDAGRHETADVSVIAAQATAGALVAVIGPPVDLGRELAAVGVTAETLRAARA